MHCPLPFIMWVANSQPKVLLAAKLLTDLWPLGWHSQVKEQVQPKDLHKSGNKMCTHERGNRNPRSHHGTDYRPPGDARANACSLLIS